MSDEAIGIAARALNAGADPAWLLDRLTPEVRAAMALLLLERGQPVQRNQNDELAIQVGSIRQARLADALGLRRAGPRMNEGYLDMAAFPGLALWGRQRGRTTRMLLDALVDLEEGHRVVILAPSVSVGIFCVNWLRAMLQELAARHVTWPNDLASSATHTGYVTSAKDLEIVLRGDPRVRIHVDHTWDEFMDERTRARALETIAAAKRSWASRFGQERQGGPWGVGAPALHGVDGPPT